MKRTVVVVWSGVAVVGGALGLLAASHLANWVEVPPESDAEPRVVASRPSNRAPTRADDVDDYLEPIGTLFESGSTTTVVSRGRVDAELLVTTVAPQPVYSSALVVVEDSSQVVQVGDRLAGSTVEAIHRGSVALRLDDGSADLLVFGAKEPAPPERTRRKPGGKPRIDWTEGIIAVDETHYEVTEEALGRALEHLGELSKLAKVVPNFANGKIDGFRIFKIRGSGPYGDLGLRDNDVLRTVNGTPLEPASILATVDALQGAQELVLEVQRNGEAVQLQYAIH
jgi:general secretion pathway protein C